MSRGLGSIKRLILGVAAVAGLATCLSIGAARAVPISFGPGDSPVTFAPVGAPGNLSMTMPAQTGNATFAGDSGTFTLGSANYFLGNFNSTTGEFTVTNLTPAPTFTYTGTDGDTLSGTLTWTSIVGNDPTVSTLTGRLDITSVAGDPAFLSNWAAPGIFGAVTWNICNSAFGGTVCVGTGLTLQQVSQGGIGQIVRLNTGLGEIEPVPGPIVGAGVPGLIFAGAGLLAWLRRRRTAVAAA